MSFRFSFASCQQASFNCLLRYPPSAAPSRHSSRIRSRNVTLWKTAGKYQAAIPTIYVMRSTTFSTKTDRTDQEDDSKKIVSRATLFFILLGAFYSLAALYFFNASVSFGTITLTSPTMPRSATSKIGAVSFLLIAMTHSEPSMPATCWIAPDMPQAR